MTSFMRRPFAGALSAAALFLFVASEASAQGGGCGAWITSPRDGASIGRNFSVEGKSSGLNYADVWIFTHRKGLPQWWPQGGGKARQYISGWYADAIFGAPNEGGQLFELAAVPVDEATSAQLAEWTERGNSTGVYPGIALPHPVPGCGYSLVTVRRAQ